MTTIVMKNDDNNDDGTSPPSWMMKSIRTTIKDGVEK
jgi:hypothetical protein